LGLGGFALADSLFVYLTSSGTYSSADLVSSSGWVFGFLIVAVAALSAVRAARPDTVSGRDRSSWGWLALPYVPLAGAGIALFEDLRRSHGHALSDLLLSVVLVVLVLTRQFLAMFDNQRLLQALAEAGGQLEHQAMHDALTGLPNRMLFAKRLDRALLAPTSSVSVLFCDLDNFKPVNDELGHAAGDLLLKTVADRLLACVRERDTVARLGGDEFAVLLVDCPDAREVADRIVASMDVETVVMGQPVRTSISVGVAHHEATVRPAPAAKHRFAETAPRHRDRSLPAERLEVAAGEAFAEREATAALLIRLADTAMYAAKSAGKGRAAVLDADPVRSSRRSSVAT
jgi:diguanylate cyclase (GGDEF)-like protein